MCEGEVDMHSMLIEEREVASRCEGEVGMGNTKFPGVMDPEGI